MSTTSSAPTPPPRPPRSRLQRLLSDWIAPLGIGLAAYLAITASRKPDVELGATAPGFTLRSPEGERVELADFAGQQVLLTFWATWCGACKMEIPMLNSFARNNPDVAVIGLNLDLTDLDQLAAASEEAGIEFDVLRAHAQLQRDYGVSTLPSTFLVDREGQLVRSHAGVITPAQLALWVD